MWVTLAAKLYFVESFYLLTMNDLLLLKNEIFVEVIVNLKLKKKTKSYLLKLIFNTGYKTKYKMKGLKSIIIIFLFNNFNTSYSIHKTVVFIINK